MRYGSQSAGGASGSISRRERLLASLTAVASYQQELRDNLADALRALPDVVVLGDGARGLPAPSITVPTVAADAVVQRLVENRMCALSSCLGDGVFDALGARRSGALCNSAWATTPPVARPTRPRGGPLG